MFTNGIQNPDVLVAEDSNEFACSLVVIDTSFVIASMLKMASL